MAKDKAMSNEEAYKHWDTLSEAFQAKDKRVTMIRDSWQGGFTVQFQLAGTCVVTRTVQNEMVSYCGRWM